MIYEYVEKLQLKSLHNIAGTYLPPHIKLYKSATQRMINMWL